MAQNIGEAQISLSVNTSQMEREVSAALKRLESRGFNLGQGINARSFTQPLGRITGAANEFQKSLDASNARVIAFGASAGAIYNVQRAFTALIGSTIEVQKSLAEINVILGASTKTLGQFGDQLFEIARNSGQAFSTVATAAGELARQGLSLEQTLKRTSDALILARLSGLDAASSVEALTASINSFNQSALDSTQIVNKLASVDAAFAVSSADLAEALKRVGSSAQDVGVSFDELLAIVASVNQTTARGGAVIGNSLKTIFTRVQRTDVLNQLEALGVAVRDLQGNTAPAIQILTGLASKFDQLGDAQRSQVAELVGGVFQINVLKAALGDLSREYSVYGNALKVATNASDEAIRRNEELNKTLAALLNRTLVNLTKVGSEIGALTFQPAIEKVLNGLNTALESFDVKGDSIGSKIGKGIFEGIGSFISGPGLALLIGVFGKIFLNLAKFTTDAVKTVLGLNKQAQAQAQIQERINTILSQNPTLVQNILNKQVSLLQVEKDILTIIQAQTRARQQSTAVAATITRGLMTRGVTAEKGVITTRTKSKGFIPNFSANKEIMGAISGGYMPGEVRSMNIPNYGRVTYNSAEEIKRFPGLQQPGIMPPEGSEAGKAYKQKFRNRYGIDPYANQGFIPNFAARPITRAETSEMISKGYVKLPGGELKDFAQIGAGKLNSIAKQYGIVEKGGESFIPEGKYNKFVLASKARLEQKAKGGAGKYYKYALVYPGFQETSPFITSGVPGKVGKSISFDAVPFPGQLKGKKNTLLGPGLYGKAINTLVDSASSFLTGLAGVSPEIVKTANFKRYLKSNISQDQIGSLVGNVFEGGILAALNIVPTTRTRTLDLTSDELARMGKTFKIPNLSKYLGGDFKNSLSKYNRDSMADKIISSSVTKALGFIPNFSPLERAFKTEKGLGGRPVLDYKEGLGLYVRDGKSQPNFAAVMKDHPEGIQKAIKNSKNMQSMVSNGFIPNFAPAGFDPMTLYFLATSLLQGGEQQQANLKSAQTKLTQILNERGEIQAQILAEEKKEIPDKRQLKNLRRKEKQLTEESIAQKKEIQSQTPVFATNRRGQFVGGIGGVASRLGSRYGTGIALAAPILTGMASQFVGDEVTRGGRGTRAIVSGIGETASYAALGTMIAPGIGTAIGAGFGVISTTVSAIKEFNDIMPELKQAAEQAQERINNVNTSTQLLSTSLETLSSIQTNSSLSAEQSVKLQQKATEDFASSLAKLDAVLPGAGQQIRDLYRKVGDTGELRNKIAELQSQAQKSSQAIISATRLISTSRQTSDLLGPTIMQRLAIGLSGVAQEGGGYNSQLAIKENLADLKKNPEKNAEKLMQYQAYVQTGAESIQSMFEGLNKTGELLSSSQVQSLIDQFNTNKIEGVKNFASTITKSGVESAYLAEMFRKANEENPTAFMDFLEEWRKIRAGAEATTKMIQDRQREILTGKGKDSRIGSLQELTMQYSQMQDGRLSPVNMGALAKTDWNAIFGPNSELGREAQMGFAKELGKNLTELNAELVNSPDKLKILAEYSDKAAKVHEELAKGGITTSEAFRRLSAEADSVKFEKNAPFMFSDERAQGLQEMLGNRLRSGDSTALQPGRSFFTSLGDDAKTTADKINKSFANLADSIETGIEDAFGAFVDGSKTAEDAFRDMMLSISQQIIKEQFSIGMRSLLGGLTGGGGFGNTSNNSGGLLGGLLGNLFGMGKAKGGIIKKYSGGGYVDGGSGIRDDVPAMLTDGEYVLRKSAVNKYGIDALNMLNRGGMIKGYAGGGGIEGMGIRGADRSASAFIRNLFYNGNNVSSYLNDPFLQANNRMVFRGGKGGGMLSKPVPFQMGGIRGQALHSTPLFPQAAGYAEGGFGMSFRNVAGKSYSIGSGNSSMPFTQRSNMVQSFYNLEDRLIMRPGSGGSVYAEAMGLDVSGIKAKDFFGARVSDTVLNNLSSEQRALTSMAPYDGLELNALGGRRGQAFLTRNFGEEAVRLPAFLRKQIDKEIKYAKISSPGYMSKPERGAFFDSLKRVKDTRRMGPTASFLDDVRMARSLQEPMGVPKPSITPTISSDISSVAKPSLFSRGLNFAKNLPGGLMRGGLNFAKNLPGGLVRGLAYAPATEFLTPPSLGPAEETLPYLLEMGRISMKQFGYLNNIQDSDRAIFNVMNRRSRGGRIKGYAAGGGVTSYLSNRYDFYGPNGDLLMGPYTPEAFKTTVNAPSELANIPALTGRFNISDLLSSRAISDEDNPMNALRTERFLGMQNYQQQAANFKTSYNEQYRQVEEARKQAQEEANRINSERMAAYNRSVTQGFIGGLIGIGTSLFSGLAGGGFFGGQGTFMGNLFGVKGAGALGQSGFGGLFGGGGSSLSNLFSGGFMGDLLGKIGGFAQGLIGGGGGGGGDTNRPISKDYYEQLTKNIESGQLSGFKDPFALSTTKGGLYSAQAQQGYRGFYPYTPASTVGGFGFNVGLGTPAGFQTRTQTPQDIYGVMSTSPFPPIGSAAIARGILTTDQYRAQLLNDTYTMGYGSVGMNPFGFAKGGIVKGYQMGGNVTGTGLSDLVIRSIMKSEGQTAIQSGKREYYGFRQGTPQFRQIQAAGRTYGFNSPITQDLVGALLTQRATKAGALNFSDPGIQGSIMSLAHMRGEGGAQAILNSVAGAPIQKSGKLSQETIGLINQMDPLIFQSMLREKRIEYDKAIYGNRIDSVVINGRTVTGKWWDLFGKGLVNRYNREQNLFSGMSVPGFKDFGVPDDRTIARIFNQQVRIGKGTASMADGILDASGMSVEDTMAVQRMLNATPEISAQASQLDRIKQTDMLIKSIAENVSSGGRGVQAVSAASLYEQVGMARNPLTSLSNLTPEIPSYLNRFAPFYGAGTNYYNQPGRSGFNNYMNYLGLGRGTSLSSLSSFSFPRTPTALNAYAFSSSPFSGSAMSFGTGIASAAPGYFSTGSRLGIAPSWASRATGGMIYGGTSYKDDVPAMLMGGEYVVRKDVVDRMGQPFFDRLNRGQIQGFAEGGPVGTGLPSVGAVDQTGNQDESKKQFVDALTKLLKSLDQLNRSVEDQTREMKDKTDNETSTTDKTEGGGVTNNISINVTVDQNGQTTDTQNNESQDSQGNDMNDQEKFKKTLERSRVLAELLRQQILKVIVEEQRPGGVLYQGSKGRDLGR